MGSGHYIFRPTHCLFKLITRTLKSCLTMIHLFVIINYFIINFSQWLRNFRMACWTLGFPMKYLCLTFLSLAPDRICSYTCANGGSCVIVNRQPRCICRPSYTGRYCGRESLFAYDDTCVCMCVCVCVTMKKSTRWMASTTSDTGDTSSKRQQPQCKQKHKKSKRSCVCDVLLSSETFSQVWTIFDETRWFIRVLW